MQWYLRIPSAAFVAIGATALAPKNANAVICGDFDITCEEASRLEVEIAVGDDCPIAQPASPGVTIRQTPGDVQPRSMAPRVFGN